MTHEQHSVKFPKGRTAFFLIHGVGEQNPFETVDYSAQNFIKYFEAQNLPLVIEHLVAKRRRTTGYIWDVKLPLEKLREQIITESLTLLKAILKDNEANYDQVILIGHSLGSCIAYDTLNLLCIEASLSKNKGKSLLIEKITGLTTFGSPLDKIAFFFREQAQKEQYIRSSILEHLNSFRVKPQAARSNLYLTKNPVDCKLHQVRWVNYYHLKDPISGHLDYYDNVNNIGMEYKATWGVEAHTGYWTDASFYEDIAQRFLYPSNEQVQS